MECKVIRDLIPLYKENMLSEESKKLVKEHLKTCSSCRNYYNLLAHDTDVEIKNENESLSFLNNTIKNDKKNLVIMIIALLVSIFLIIISYVSKPLPIDYKDNLINIKSDNENVNIEFSDEVTRVDTDMDTYDGYNIYYVDGYTTKIDKKLNNRYVGLKIPKDDVDIIAYTNNGENTNKILYDTSRVFESGGTVALPRLILGIYAKLALIVLGISIILILTFFKKLNVYNKIRIISVPFSYLASTFFVKSKNLSSNYLVRDFIFIILTVLAIYLFIYSITLYLKQKSNHKLEI